MSKNGRTEVSPSLFPFLAVLLCTVGALVLILVIIVSQSQASVQQATTERDERAAELKAKVEVVRDSFREDREKIQLEIEKKRLSLQGLEQQASELIKELEELGKTAELIDKKLANEDDAEESTEAALSELEKKLQEAAAALKTKIEKPTGDKPVFAIVPYEGTNGTHRRPIYLECRAEGIVIQPEGVVIGLKDLKPPYGPGNPLDAALRTIRTHYAPKDGGLNTSAYPLLVVRASGIRTYALARMAMAGWDDQFGYELVEDDMELSFPEGEPGLDKEIETSLVTARNRQAALVMAMPGRYRKQLAELTDDDFSFEGGEGGFESGGGGAGGGFGEEDAYAGEGADSRGGAKLGGGSAAGGDLTRSADGGPGYPPSSGARAGFAYAPDGSGLRPTGGSAAALAAGRSGAGSGGLQGFATGGDSLASGSTAQNSSESGNWPGSAGNSSEPGGAQSFAEGAFGGNQYTRGAAGSGGGADGRSTPGEAGGQMASGSEASSANSTNARPGNFRDAMTAARAKPNGNADSRSSQAASGGANSSAADAGSGGSQTASPRSEGFASAGAAANTNDPASAMNPDDSVTPSASLSARKKAQENAEAVAKRKGRNWAWSAGPARDTAIVRSIRIVCYEDRWLVLPEVGSTRKPETIMLDVALQTSAEELAKVVADRVDRWGFALSGGYWKPVLEVEVAPRGQRRFDQLKRLLDGSGLDIQLAQPQAPARPTTR